MAPRNRKERRAAAAASNPSVDESIPLGFPSREPGHPGQHVKTLYEIAAERTAGAAGTSAGSLPKTEFIHITPSGEISMPESADRPSAEHGTTVNVEDSDVDDTNSKIPPLPDTLLSSFPLSILHLTLSFLAVRQYDEDVPVSDLVRDTLFIAFPALTFLIHLSHGHIISLDISRLWRSAKLKGARETAEATKEAVEEPQPTAMRALFPLTARNFIFLLVSLLLGAKLIAIANDAGYYVLMKKAPPIGTLWAWTVMEMSAGFSALGLLLPLGWAVLYKGYGII